MSAAASFSKLLPPSHPVLCILLQASCLSVPPSASFDQYIHRLSSGRVQTIWLYLQVSKVHCPSDVLIPNAILVTPRENLGMLIFATSISAACLFLSAAASEPYKIAHAHSHQRFVNLSFHSCRDCRRDVTPVVFSSTRSNLLAHALRASGMLTLSTSNPPRRFICAPCHRISPRECELNQTLKLK